MRTNETLSPRDGRSARLRRTTTRLTLAAILIAYATLIPLKLTGLLPTDPSWPKLLLLPLPFTLFAAWIFFRTRQRLGGNQGN